MANANSTCIDFSLSGVVCYGVFFNYEENENISSSFYGVNCSSIDNFDPDVAGIGVVISFTVSAIITTLASIAAAVLDHIADSDKPLLPERWKPKKITETVRERSLFARRILDRLILDFADQQLVTGFALLISAWVKLHSNAAIERLPPEQQDIALRYPNLSIPNAEFSLIVFLCMASSSSHLASVLVLREYMETHRSSARLRMALMVLFACFLAVTISLASSLTAYFAWIVSGVFSLALSNEDRNNPPEWLLVLDIALCMAIPLLVILAIFWVCTLQLSPRLKGKVQDKVRSIVLARLRKWFRLTKIWHFVLMQLVPRKRRALFTKSFKQVFWFIILGNEFVVFLFQVILATLSVMWVGLQRLALPPDFWSYGTKPPLCSLHKVAGEGEWASFGQLLPLIFLVLPLFSAYGSYTEEKDRKKEMEARYSTLEGEPSPDLPRVPSRKQKQSSYRDESELSLLSPRSQRHESDASQGSATGIGAAYDGQSPPPRAYSIGGLGIEGSGTMGWPSGYSTGVDEEAQATPGGRR